MRHNSCMCTCISDISLTQPLCSIRYPSELLAKGTSPSCLYLMFARATETARPAAEKSPLASKNEAIIIANIRTESPNISHNRCNNTGTEGLYYACLVCPLGSWRDNACRSHHLYSSKASRWHVCLCPVLSWNITVVLRHRHQLLRPGKQHRGRILPAGQKLGSPDGVASAKANPG